jgi:hypothetical protein
MRGAKYSFMRFFLLFLLSLLVSCTDVPDSDLELQPTQLKVRILDENYQQVTTMMGKVYLYRDYVSFLTKTGAVAMSTVSKDGLAHFTNLDPYNYFIYAVYKVGNNVYDNSTSAFNLFDYLTENAITTITVKTNLALSGTPMEVEINSINIIPLNKNTYWVGLDYDTLWSEFMIIKDYDYSKKLSDQDVVAKSDLYFLKNIRFGEFINTYPRTNALESVTLPLSSIKPLNATNPLKSSYVIYTTFFTKKSDFMNRSQIYNENSTATGYYNYEFLSLSGELVDATMVENPYPQLLFLDQTYYQKNNYLIFTKLTWK